MAWVPFSSTRLALSRGIASRSRARDGLHRFSPSVFPCTDDLVVCAASVLVITTSDMAYVTLAGKIQNEMIGIDRDERPLVNQSHTKTMLKLFPAIAALMLALNLSLSTPVRAADEITVAAASDLTFAFKDVAAKFQAQTGDVVKLSFGSSGNFFSQIQNGAPFDLFFSADISYAKKLEDGGLAEPGTLYQYATGKIVLWVPADSKLDVSKGLAVL